MEFTYNHSFVALSIGVAILGSFTGLVMTSGIRQGEISAAKLRMVLGALGVGGGIWSMHFIAMLAMKMDMLVSYDLLLTGLHRLPPQRDGAAQPRLPWRKILGIEETEGWTTDTIPAILRTISTRTSRQDLTKS